MIYRLKELLTEKISGEWGDKGYLKSGVKVIRTTNFTNSGKLNLENLAYRQIDSRKVMTKRLKKGDIIIEKSGGSPTQPVGRVVFFDVDTDETFLCNNFTTVLRPDRSKVAPLYLFYRLFDNHKTGKTLRYQNKTTGIINLKLDHYLNSKLEIPERVDDQIRIATILSKAEALIAQRKESLRLLDELLKSTFLEMFGDPVRNEKGWKVKKLKNVIKSVAGGWSPVCDNSPRNSDSEWAILKLGAVTYGYFDPSENKKLKPGTEVKKTMEALKGDLLFTRKNTRELVAAVAYVFEDHPKLLLSDTIFKLIYDKTQANGIFLWKLLSTNTIRKQIQKLATGSAGSMPNISQQKLLNFSVYVPPFSFQTKFAQIVEKVEALKAHYQASLKELENLYGSLSQRAFKGEL